MDTSDALVALVLLLFSALEEADLCCLFAGMRIATFVATFRIPVFARVTIDSFG